MHRPIGAFLVEEGFIEAHQLRMALGHQDHLRRKSLGEILVERYGLPRATLAEAIREQHEALCRMDDGERPVPLHTHLLERGVVDRQTLARALWWQRKLRKKRIGDILVELGYIERDRLEAAIRAQLDELAVA